MAAHIFHWQNRAHLKAELYEAALKSKAPQYELPQAETVFNLITQTTTDGAQAQEELDTLAKGHRAAQELETKQQPTLL